MAGLLTHYKLIDNIINHAKGAVSKLEAVCAL